MFSIHGQKDVAVVAQARINREQKASKLWPGWQMQTKGQLHQGSILHLLTCSVVYYLVRKTPDLWPVVPLCTLFKFLLGSSATIAKANVRWSIKTQLDLFSFFPHTHTHTYREWESIELVKHKKPTGIFFKKDFKTFNSLQVKILGPRSK